MREEAPLELKPLNTSSQFTSRSLKTKNSSFHCGEEKGN